MIMIQQKHMLVIWTRFIESIWLVSFGDYLCVWTGKYYLKLKNVSWKIVYISSYSTIKYAYYEVGYMTFLSLVHSLGLGYLQFLCQSKWKLILARVTMNFRILLSLVLIHIDNSFSPWMFLLSFLLSFLQ